MWLSLLSHFKIQLFSPCIYILVVLHSNREIVEHPPSNKCKHLLHPHIILLPHPMWVVASGARPLTVVMERNIPETSMDLCSLRLPAHGMQSTPPCSQLLSTGVANILRRQKNKHLFPCRAAPLIDAHRRSALCAFFARRSCTDCNGVTNHLATSPGVIIWDARGCDCARAQRPDSFTITRWC